MHFSTSAALVLGLGALRSAYGHTLMTSVYVNGEPQGAGTCVRVNQDGNTRVNFVPSLSGKEMACGIDGEKGVARKCPAKAGDTITFEWNSGENKEGHLADSHKGPCSIMMKKVESALTDPGDGDGWFRIFYEGFNQETGKWCTERMMADGHISVKIPGDLLTGDYLVRSELLALHSASQNDPQFYVSCVQLVLTAGGTAQPQTTVAIPSDAYAKLGSEAMSFNYYYPPDVSKDYPDYGPATYVASGEGGSGPAVTQTDGLRPDDCIFEAGNWCGKEVSSYTDESGCWESAKECWTQGDACWKSVFIDQQRCQQWSDKCENIGAQCRAKNFPGPPDAGKDITVEPSRPNVPAAVNDAGVIQSGGSGTPTDSPSSSSSSSSSSVTAPTAATTPSESTGYGYGDDSKVVADSSANTGSESESKSETAPANTGSDDDSDSGDDSPAVVADAGSDEDDSTPVQSPAPVVTPSPDAGCPTAVTETVTQTETATVTVQPQAYRK